MKALQCEMCGSHDLIKKDGVLFARIVEPNTHWKKQENS